MIHSKHFLFFCHLIWYIINYFIHFNIKYVCVYIKREKIVYTITEHIFWSYTLVIISEKCSFILLQQPKFFKKSPWKWNFVEREWKEQVKWHDVSFSYSLCIIRLELNLVMWGRFLANHNNWLEGFLFEDEKRIIIEVEWKRRKLQQSGWPRNLFLYWNKTAWPRTTLKY